MATHTRTKFKSPAKNQMAPVKNHVPKQMTSSSKKMWIGIGIAVVAIIIIIIIILLVTKGRSSGSVFFF